MRINKKYFNLILIGVMLVPFQALAFICTGTPLGFWDAFTCGDTAFGIVGSMFFIYAGFVRFLIWGIFFGMILGAIKYFRNKQESKNKRTDTGLKIFKIFYGIIFALILFVVILGELSHFGYSKELDTFTEDLHQQSLKYQEEAEEREKRRQMELEDMWDIRYERRGIIAYSPANLPSNRYQKKQSFYNEGSDSIIQWVTFDGSNVFSIKNSNEEKVFFQGDKGDVFGQTDRGEDVYIKRSSSGERSIFTTKIGDTYLRLDVGYYMPELVDVLEPEMLKIINSMEPVN